LHRQLNTFIIPRLFEFIQANNSMGKTDAKQAILAEGFRNLSLNDYCSGTPARTIGHPFSKLLGASAQDIAQRWASPANQLTIACPDFGLRLPFPFKIVFEGKYFNRGSFDKALNSNVKNGFWQGANVYVMILGGST
jgi:hypothetical protein